jgi:hypothetical protein
MMEPVDIEREERRERGAPPPPWAADAYLLVPAAINYYPESAIRSFGDYALHAAPDERRHELLFRSAQPFDWYAERATVMTVPIEETVLKRQPFGRSEWFTPRRRRKLARRRGRRASVSVPKRVDERTALFRPEDTPQAVQMDAAEWVMRAGGARVERVWK